MEQKLKRLRELLSAEENVAVAFSAGVDSTFLLAVAHEELGERVVALTALSLANPAREADGAAKFCSSHGIRQVAFEVDEFQIDGFERNPVDRCYHCKKHLFEEMIRRAKAEGLSCVIEGSNADDLGDYRPGSRALAELGIRSPLQECGLTKAEIRALSREMGLPTWNKPSFACLYTRFPYGDLLTREKIERVDAAEQFLLDLGVDTVRVRSVGSGGDTARIEVDSSDIVTLAEPSRREAVIAELKRLGFAYVTLDLQGYRTGSMNETLQTG